MKPNEFKPYQYMKPDWENNPKWLFDAYRSVILKNDVDSRKNLNRFVKWLATEDKLTDPNAIGIITYDNNLVVGAGIYAEKVVTPFMPLIEAITDEMLELGKVVGHDHLDLMRQEASVILQQGTQKYIKDAGPPSKQLAEKWAIDEMRKQLRNKVAAAMFKGIREYAFAEYLHREHEISDEAYQQALDKIESGLNKAGINGLSRFLQANPHIEETLSNDDRKFIPYNYKMTEEGQEQPYPKWFPNDREKEQVRRSEYYQWQMQDIGDKQGNPSFEEADYRKAHINAIYNTIGPEYCEAVKKRDAAMRKYSLGHGGKATEQTPHHHAFYLGHDLSNAELESLIAIGGTKDLPVRDAEAIYKANNMLGSLDPRLSNSQEQEKDTPANEGIEAQKKSHGVSGSENGQKESAPAGDAAKDQQQKAAPETHHQDKKANNKEADDQACSTNDDPPKDANRKKISNGIMAGSAVLGSILVADQLHRAGKKDHKEASTEAGKEKGSKALNYVLATAAAVGVGIIVCTKPDKLVKFYDDIGGLLGGRGQGK